MTTLERRREALEGGIKCALTLSDHAQLVYLRADPVCRAATQDNGIQLADLVDRAGFALDRLAEGIVAG